jgi:hypothetical protein
MITLVVLVNVVFLGVLIWKAVWLIRKIRGYPSSGDSAGGTADSGPDDNAPGHPGSKLGPALGSESHTHEQSDAQH